MNTRQGKIERNTKETAIRVELSLDGGDSAINTGVGFFDHMLSQVARHGNLGLVIEAKGDLHVDCHHTAEDVGIALGQALRAALGDFSGICRYGSALVPMDEALALCAIDCCNRAGAYVDNPFTTAKIGELDVEMIPEFFRATAANAGINIHILVYRGVNNHHIAEAMFKSFGRALKDAVSRTQNTDILSTKGVL
ncbi:MAG: imidazoleglycerol-phosphate dehydratase HisB [Fusobacteriaceae bacterium]|jgi:imidazoleglycerol-phosphate dehydratase|nr:imidazoleglycerol-phosphate dehydratase HisB [Fusobacteriaceae bacterium]